MGATQTRTVHRTWPIAYGRPRYPTLRADARLAWALFLGLGVPAALVGALTTLARAGIYVEPFRPLWLPWPPDVLKSVLGFTGFAATLAYLAHRLGWRSGIRAGTAAGIAAARNGGDLRRPVPRREGRRVPAKIPPPPPPEPWD